MKIYIHYDFKDTPFGGGNQFLKALKQYLIEKKYYTTNPKNAEVILFNSFEYATEIISLKVKFPDKIFLHRIDGPIQLYNKSTDKRDFIVNSLNLLADGTIFQSTWSKNKNYSLGFKKSNHEKIILNAPDKKVFNKKDKEFFSPNRKLRIIATSWSSNIKKGFPTYKWMDNQLDFSLFDITFVGNSPIPFKNIKHVLPIPSSQLQKLLKKHDIFITASEKDPCSNSLLEALHCGLPALALNDGGHPEIIKKAGELFNKTEEIPSLLDKIKQNYFEYQARIELLDINEVGERYYQFANSIHKKVQEGTYITIKLRRLEIMQLKATLIFYKILSKKNTLISRLKKLKKN